jgi:hypothetical protein
LEWGKDFEVEGMTLSQMSGSFAAAMISLRALCSAIMKTVQSLVGIRVAALKEISTAPKGASIKKIINDYGALIERHPPRSTRIEDVSVLPHPKEVILDALLSEIGRGHSKHMDDMLRVGAIYLAQYQSGVGNEPLEPRGTHKGKLPRANGLDELRAEAKKRERFDQFNKLVESDLRRISLRIADLQP